MILMCSTTQYVVGTGNRKGLLCRECVDGYGPGVFSLDLKCANCSKMSTGTAIILYLLIKTIPITLLFACVAMFHINITSGPLLGYMIFCQFYVWGTKVYTFIVDYILLNSDKALTLLEFTSLTLCDFWNLNFFTLLIPPFCISKVLTTAHLELLDLYSPIYLLMLFVFTCIIIEHYPHKTIIQKLWKPFNILISKINHKQVGKDSVVHAFATVILLSSATNLYILAILSKETFILSYFANGTCQRYKDTVYIDSSVTYYSHRHVIYICIAVIPCIFLVIIPSILLFVYPTRLYRFSSRFISARKRLAITAFTEALNNSFKDSLNGTHDYRALAGLVLITFPVGVIINFTVWKIMLYLHSYNRSLINAHICFGSSFLIASVRPCKSKLANLSLSYHLMMMGVLGITCYLWSNDLSTGTKVLKYTIIIIPLISHLLVLAWLIRSIIRCIYSRWVYKIIYINTNTYASLPAESDATIKY